MQVVFTQVTTTTVNIFPNYTFTKENLKIQRDMVKAHSHYIAKTLIQDHLKTIARTVKEQSTSQMVKSTKETGKMIKEQAKEHKPG